MTPQDGGQLEAPGPDFEFTPAQEQLRADVRELLKGYATPSRVRVSALNEGFAREAWRAIAVEHRLSSLGIRPDLGGAGGGFVETGIVIEEIGRTLLPVPFLSTVAATTTLEAGGEREVAEMLLASIAKGSTASQAVGASIGMRAHPEGRSLALDGTATNIADGNHSSVVVVSARAEGEPVLVVVDLLVDGVEIELEPTRDPTRRRITLSFDGAPVMRLTKPGAGAEAVERARRVLDVAHALEAVGSAAACLQLVDEPIRADLRVELDAARRQAHRAAGAVDEGHEQLSTLGPAARSAAERAFLRVATEAARPSEASIPDHESNFDLFLERALAAPTPA